MLIALVPSAFALIPILVAWLAAARHPYPIAVELDARVSPPIAVAPRPDAFARTPNTLHRSPATALAPIAIAVVPLVRAFVPIARLSVLVFSVGNTPA